MAGPTGPTGATGAAASTGWTSVTLNNSVTTLNSSSSKYIYFAAPETGTPTLRLPDVSTIPLGTTYVLHNSGSTSTTAIQTSNATFITNVAAGKVFSFTSNAITGATAAVWTYYTSSGSAGANGATGPTGATGATGATVGTSIVYGYQGTLAVTTGLARYYLESSGTVTRIRASVGTAPTGSSIIVTLLENGISVGTATIAAGAFTGTTTLSSTYVAGDYLTANITQVGSTIAGTDLTVTVTLA